jgi:CMP-N-acetylneuraminic acid synthetase
MKGASYKTVALLPMKANSERVKGKNFKYFAGRPLFRWILDSLLEVEEIEKIIINTDAREILKENGLVETDRILIRDRKEDICGDFVSMNKIIEDDLVNIESEVYLMTHTTNPLLTSGSIRGALNAYHEGRKEGKDSLFTVTDFQTRFYRADGSAVNHDPKKLMRTQDLETWYEENSNLYIFTRDSFSKTHARIGENPLLYETLRTESADIDDQIGWKMAEIYALSQQIFRAHH